MRLPRRVTVELVSDVEQEERETVTTSCTPTVVESCLTQSGDGTLGTDFAYFEYQ